MRSKVFYELTRPNFPKEYQHLAKHYIAFNSPIKEEFTESRGVIVLDKS